MYGDFILLEKDGSGPVRARRLPNSVTAGRNESWLRDTLLAHPSILPVDDIDPSFGPLVSLCKEARTAAGPLDALFINPYGKLTLVECKLWKNPEARRKVVAQILDYASAISKWTYSELQSKVASALGRPAITPFDLVSSEHAGLDESRFIDATASALQQGRFLLLIVGDGIREDVSAIAEYIQNSSINFTLGLVEVALYGLDDSGVVVHPRVLAKTKTIERVVYLPRHRPSEMQDSAATIELVAEVDSGADIEPSDSAPNSRHEEYRQWWTPVMNAKLYHPDQAPPVLHWPNNVRLQLPWPNVWISAYRYKQPNGDTVVGIGTGGRSGADQELVERLEPFRDELLEELPAGSNLLRTYNNDGFFYGVTRNASEFQSDHECRGWVIATLNGFVNALRPRIKMLQSSREGS